MSLGKGKTSASPVSRRSPAQQDWAPSSRAQRKGSADEPHPRPTWLPLSVYTIDVRVVCAIHARSYGCVFVHAYCTSNGQVVHKGFVVFESWCARACGRTLSTCLSDVEMKLG